MSGTFRVDPDFFEEFLDEDPFETRRRRKQAGRHRRMRQSVRSATTATEDVRTDQLDMGLTSTVRDWEPAPKIFT